MTFNICNNSLYFTVILFSHKYSYFEGGSRKVRSSERTRSVKTKCDVANPGGQKAGENLDHQTVYRKPEGRLTRRNRSANGNKADEPSSLLIQGAKC